MKWVEKAKNWLSEHPSAEAVLWFLAAIGCIAVLAWFLLFSGYGAPPDFVYKQF